MPGTLEAAVAEYLADLHRIRSTGAGTDERSYYPALSRLLNAVGHDLKPKVFCVPELRSTGAGHPDFGLYTANQCQKGQPRPGAMPERGVIEVKRVADDAWLTAETRQVSAYWATYRHVLVTNLRDFLLIGEDAQNRAIRLESFRLADGPAAFWEAAAHPVRTARESGSALAEYLRRALTLSVSLFEPKDVAWILASYARDALQRVESAGNVPALATVRSSLEQSLGVHFQSERGEHFFRSTLVQTLFYGIFSAWVLWARHAVPAAPAFDWRLSGWYLKVPMLRALFQQLADPGRLEPLGLVEVLEWTAHTLARIDRTRFFARFKDAEAVQYFYEPFLEAFDPELRQQLGVWYTPNEVVDYMVARVDRSLRDDLGIADGLAAENVFVLDPCCGTGAFLAAVLRRIDATLHDRGLGALKGAMLRKAAMERVFGFEIMAAPFVVSHLQVGLLLHALDAPLADDGSERAAVFLTNALTGWEPMTNKPLPFPEMEEERKRADTVKQQTRILVILGNPPYNGFAGMAVEEERALTTAYRTVSRVRRPQGQGLNDLYVRFYRMAERRIVEKTGEGIVCFISNYSWLDGLSFTGMRERFLDAFDAIRIDCLNGDKFKTGKLTPDGKPDPSVFSTEHNREGIQVGTAIATLVRRRDHAASDAVQFRHLWGQDKPDQLTATAIVATEQLYTTLQPAVELGLPFVAATVSSAYGGWPGLPDLMPLSFPGVKTSRDDFLVAIDRDTLEARIAAYFDPGISHEELRRRYPSVMQRSARYDPEATRDALRQRGPLMANVVRYAYRPFDLRWIYWEPETELLDRKRSEYWPHVTEGTFWFSAGARNRKADFYQPQVVSRLADHHLVESNVGMFPTLQIDVDHGERRPNLSRSASRYLNSLAGTVDALFAHVVAILHASVYRSENAGALRMDWPRIPLPMAASVLSASAQIGDTLGSLLNPDADVPGVTAGARRPELLPLARPARNGGGHLSAADLVLTAGWGHVQRGGIVMPARGKVIERDYTAEERAAFADGATALNLSETELVALLGRTTFDVWLNEDAYWANVPCNVWSYTLGGYQVVKKWLSYRERDILGRALRPDEVQYVSEMIRRIAAILLLGPALDRNYETVRANALRWDGPESLHAFEPTAQDATP